MSAKRILSVGQCLADHGSLAGTLQRELGAEVVPADTHADALERLRDEAFDLVLVNRLLDRDGSPGLEVIRSVKADEKLRSVPVLLVSNFEDAQREAWEAGAEPGFGKSALGTPEMLEAVQRFL